MMTQTQTLTVPYSHDTFHTAKPISEAVKEYYDRDGQKFVDEILAPIVKKHNMTEQFGTTLVHRHFDIDPSEKLVEFNNISTPWKVNVGFNKFNGSVNSLIYETAWMLNADDKWMSYEHAFSPVKGQDSYIVDIRDPKYEEFLKEFTAALKKGGWEQLLGLRAWPGKGFKGTFEFTQGKANINLAPEQFDMNATEGFKYAETMWFWEDNFIMELAGCYCATGRHGGHVGNTCGPKGPQGDIFKA